ncbi:MAG: C40 family peptidase, partial [Myxococcota bacterium]
AADGAAVVETARGYLGYPYVYGDEGTYGFDCSGFVQSVYATHGLRIPRTAGLQSKIGEPVGLGELRAGDLVLFNPSPSSNRISHVGIATGDGRVIHASSGRGEVVIDSISGYWTRHGAEGRRVIGTPFEELGDMGPEPAREHLGPMPVSLGSSATPGLWHRGLVDLDRRTTALGVKTGLAASPDRETVLWVNPSLELRWDARDAELAVQVPLAFSTTGESRFEYERGTDGLRLLDRVRIGTPDAAVYLEASREVSLSLGEGSLVQGVTPNATSRSVAGLPSRGAFAVAARATVDRWRTAFVLDDILAPA